MDELQTYKTGPKSPDIYVYTSLYAQVSLTSLKGQEFDKTYVSSYLWIILLSKTMYM